METVEHAYIKTNGITLHVAQKGPADGELILLLHGFPEFWYGWCKQITYLADQGFRVWAPDQRGYNLSDKPDKVSDYHIEHLAADVAGLIKASGKEKVFLVGHDWGGIVAWRVAREYPDLLHKLVILNAPHEAAMKEQVLHHPFQILKSSYIGFFQLPGVPERLFSVSGWKPATKALKATSQKGTFSEAELDEYRTAWSQPRAMHSMINWYRALVRYSSNQTVPSRVTVPTFLIWGAKDQFLGQELANKSLEFCDNGRGRLIGEATHWVQHEEAEQVNQWMLDFIQE
ncbi:alpha/beta hydrolase [Desemzia sp. RIT804]|uniref:alpha/beta fold hydrolase n=1 Tax=Desemzia sp. RIT 804 TaxID=2810209 RepID=UPI00194E22DB|nr:alpha/beta hydrolase [Desemzia sp. RIT 804]MBM6615869.1 alpha/beta hydrolase [Desemzia sp. RIT 804]